MARLSIRKHNGEMLDFRLEGASIFIGKNDRSRNVFNDLVLDDDTVSRQHARIYMENRHYYIEDLSSRNHTYLNDERIKKARLSDKDTIRIGLNTIVFISDANEPDPSGKFVAIEETDAGHTVDLNYLFIQRITETAAEAASAEEFASWVIEQTCQTIGAEHGSILVPDSAGGYLGLASFGQEPRFSRSVVQRVFASGKPERLNDEIDASDTMLQLGIGSVMCAPMHNKSSVFAAIYLDDAAPNKFSAFDLRFLNDIAVQAAVGLDRLVLSEDIVKEKEARSSLERFLKNLQASKDTSLALLSANPDLMLQLHEDGVVLSCKMPRVRTAFITEDVTGKNLSEFLPEPIQQATLGHLNRSLIDESVQVFQFSLTVDEGLRHYENRMAACGPGEVLSIIRDITERIAAEKEREQLIQELREALGKIKTLSGLVPICSACKKIRDDNGYWNQLEAYIQAHSEVEFSHGICDPCAKKLYGDFFQKDQEKE